MCACSAMSDFLWPRELQRAKLLCPWKFPGKNTGVGCISFSRGSSQPGDWTHISRVSCLAGGLFTTEPGLTISLTNNFSIFRQVVWEPCLGPVQVKDGPGVVDWVIVSHRRGQEFLECSDPMSATFHSSWQFSYQRNVEDVEMWTGITNNFLPFRYKVISNPRVSLHW